MPYIAIRAFAVLALALSARAAACAVALKFNAHRTAPLPRLSNRNRSRSKQLRLGSLSQCLASRYEFTHASELIIFKCLFEVSAEESLLLPFDQFVFAELKSDGKEQWLRLVFATHEVTLRGYSLRRIETAMQRSELSLLSALSGEQRSLIPDGQPVVIEIIVTDMKALEKAPRDAGP
jgi:hypothetical protein